VLTYDEVMLRYGTTSRTCFPLQIAELSDVFTQSEFRVFRAALESGGVVRGLRAPGGAALSRTQIDALTELAKTEGAEAWLRVRRGGLRAARSDREFLSEAEQRALVER